MTDGERQILDQLKQIMNSTDASLLVLREILEELRNQGIQQNLNRR